MSTKNELRFLGIYSYGDDGAVVRAQSPGGTLRHIRLDVRQLGEIAAESMSILRRIIERDVARKEKEAAKP